MVKSDDCYSCAHSYYETNEATFCPDCFKKPDGEMSNYEAITDEDIELFCSELNIQIVDHPESFEEINELISEPVA